MNGYAESALGIMTSVANWLVTSKMNPNARKVTRVSMINPFWLNSMKTKAFHQLYHLNHSGTEPSV